MYIFNAVLYFSTKKNHYFGSANKGAKIFPACKQASVEKLCLCHWRHQCTCLGGAEDTEWEASFIYHPSLPGHPFITSALTTLIVGLQNWLGTYLVLAGDNGEDSGAMTCEKKLFIHFFTCWFNHSTITIQQHLTILTHSFSYTSQITFESLCLGDQILY